MNGDNFFDQTGDRAIVTQWKYTACRYNIENSNGFYTFSKSREMSREEKEELIETVAHYNQLDSAPLRPTAVDLNDPTKFPVAFTHFKLSNGKSVICRARAVGQDYGGTRYGNFFAHAFVLSDGVWRDPIRYFVSSTFDDGLTAEEANLGRTPEPLPTLGLDGIEPGRKSDAFSSDLNALRALAAGFAEALRRRKNLIVGASPENLANAARYLGDFFAVLPPEIASKIEFTTYSYNPTNEELFARAKYVFLAFAPLETARDVPEEKAVVVDLDAALRGKPNVVASWANALSPQFLAFAKNFAYAGKLAAPPSDPSIPQIRLETEKTDERTLDLRYLNGLTVIYAMTQGVFPQIERGWEDAWSFLSADKQTFLRERWIETWRFLNEQPFEIGLAVAQTLLRLDLSRFAQPELKLQKNVWGIEAFTERTGYLKNRFDVLLTRNILSYAVVFCAKNRLENLEAANEVMRRFVAFWARSIPTSEKENKVWRGELPNEIPEIFGMESPAFIATITMESLFGSSQRFDALAELALHSFLEVPNPNIWQSWLAIALGIQIALETPQALGSQVKTSLQQLFSKYFALGNAIAEFERVYLKLFVERIKDATSYSLIFEILGIANDENKLKEYANGRLISDACLAAWERGESLKLDDAINIDVNFDDVNTRNGAEDVEFWDDKALIAEKLGKKPKVGSNKSRLQDAAPGSIAFVDWLARNNKNEILAIVFGNFGAGQFKNAKRLLGSYGINLRTYEREFTAQATWRYWAFGVVAVLFVAGAFGFCAWKLQWFGEGAETQTTDANKAAPAVAASPTPAPNIQGNENNDDAWNDADQFFNSPDATASQSTQSADVTAPAEAKTDVRPSENALRQ